MPSTSRGRPETKKAAKRIAPPLEIGWREWVALPALGVGRIRAKIDTGAKTSAIHAHDIREVMRGGTPFVEFYIHPVEKRRHPQILCSAPIMDRRMIRSSNGVAQERLIIVTKLKLGGKSWSIEISLANRDDMGFRLLIGRDALRGGVLVNPAKSYLLGR